MAAAVAEVDDLKCCSICFYLYDADARKPKYFSCHHTFCLKCIKLLPKNLLAGGDKASTTVVCPKCRETTTCIMGREAELATNTYAVYMITADQLPIHAGRFCLSCKKEAVPSCMNAAHYHPTFSMGSKSAEFCLQLLEFKDRYEARLSSVIQKRNEAKTYLQEVSTAHKLVGETIQRLDDENKAHFGQMNSLLESSGTIHAGETAQSFSLKVKEASDKIKEELTDVQVLNKTYLQHINGRTEIRFSCHREEKELYPHLRSEKMAQRKIRNANSKAAAHVLFSLFEISGESLAASPPLAPVVTSRSMPKVPQTAYPSSPQPGTSTNRSNESTTSFSGFEKTATASKPQLLPAVKFGVAPDVDFDVLRNNKSLLTKLLKQVSAVNPDNPLNLNKAGKTLMTRSRDQQYLLIDWKQLHRCYHDEEIHIRIFSDPDENVDEDEVIIIPVDDGNLILLPGEDVATKNLSDYVDEPNLPAILDELLEPTVASHRLTQKHYAILLLCTGSYNRWKLLSHTLATL